MTMSPRSLNSIAYAVIVLFVLVSANALFSNVRDWAQIKLDDMRYGRPRAMHVTAFVGHGEEGGTPTHLIAMNLDRQVVIIEMPGGDASQARTITGPYLFGAGEDLTPVQLRLSDVNRDNRPDMVVSVKAEEMIYINQEDGFRMISAEERQTLLQQGYR